MSTFILAGCGMTNEEIIVETKICEDAGMVAHNMANGFTFNTTRVQCEKKVDDNMMCPNPDKKVVDIEIVCKDGKEGCTEIFKTEDGSVCKK